MWQMAVVHHEMVLASDDDLRSLSIVNFSRLASGKICSGGVRSYEKWLVIVSRPAKTFSGDTCPKKSVPCKCPLFSPGGLLSHHLQGLWQHLKPRNRVIVTVFGTSARPSAWLKSFCSTVRKAPHDLVFHVLHKDPSQW